MWRLVQIAKQGCTALSASPFLPGILYQVERKVQFRDFTKGSALSTFPFPSLEHLQTSSADQARDNKAGDGASRQDQPQSEGTPKQDSPQAKPGHLSNEALKKDSPQPSKPAETREAVSSEGDSGQKTSGNQPGGKGEPSRKFNKWLIGCIGGTAALVGKKVLDYVMKRYEDSLWNQLELGYESNRSYVSELKDVWPDFDQFEPLAVDSNSILPSNKQSSPIPAHFITMMRILLSSSTKLILLTEGQKGIGKTTMTRVLCWHLNNNSQPTLFLRFTPEKQGANEKILLADPESIQKLARTIRSRGKVLTVIIDDLHKILRDANSAQSQALVSTLWMAAEECGARIILTTSEYGIVDTIHELKAVRTVRFSKMRMPAPPSDVLAALVEQLAKNATYTEKTKGIDDEEKARYWEEGNSKRHIDLYCQVVGNYRTANDSLTSGLTVNDAIKEVFEESLKEVIGGLDKMCDPSGNLINPNQIAQIFSTLCENQKFTPAEYSERKLCSELAKMNIIRPMSSKLRSYEFHRFSIEVAVRALLGKPVEGDHIARMKKAQVEQGFESCGRGTTQEIDALVAQADEFQKTKAAFQNYLKLGKSD